MLCCSVYDVFRIAADRDPSEKEFPMRKFLGMTSLLATFGATLLAGCASTESVEMAQATANHAVQAAQVADQKAEQAGQAAQNAHQAAQQAQATANTAQAIASSAQATASSDQATAQAAAQGTSE